VDIGDAVDEPVDPVDIDVEASTAVVTAGDPVGASLDRPPHAAATSASATSTRIRPTIRGEEY
jgi:hypothetical protein